MSLVVAFAGLAVAGTLLRVFVVSRLNSPAFPWGTLAVNVTGSFALGLLGTASPEVVTLVGVAALGSFTTFSTFAHESVVMAREQRGTLAVVYTAATVGAGIAAAAIGLALSP